MSIAGGLPRAVDRAEAARCDALQIFTKSAGQWRARPLPAEEVDRFRARVRETRIHPVVAHNSYLINVATAQPELRARSIEALGEELDRAAMLGLDGLVMHPGSYTSGREADGLRLIAEALRQILDERPDDADTDPARAHGGAGHEPRSPLRAPGRDHRTDSMAVRGSVSASTRAICLPPATTSVRRRATGVRSTSSTGRSASRASRPSI